MSPNRINLSSCLQFLALSSRPATRQAAIFGPALKRRRLKIKQLQTELKEKTM